MARWRGICVIEQIRKYDIAADVSVYITCSFEHTLIMSLMQFTNWCTRLDSVFLPLSQDQQGGGVSRIPDKIIVSTALS